MCFIFFSVNDIAQFRKIYQKYFISLSSLSRSSLNDQKGITRRSHCHDIEGLSPARVPPRRRREARIYTLPSITPRHGITDTADASPYTTCRQIVSLENGQRKMRIRGAANFFGNSTFTTHLSLNGHARDLGRHAHGPPPEERRRADQQLRKVKRMSSIVFRAMTVAIIVIAVICATGLASAQVISPVQPDQPTLVAPPEPPTPTPSPTRLPVVGITERPPAQLPTDPTVGPTQLPMEPTVTPTPPAPPTAPTTGPTQSPTTGPPRPPAVQPTRTPESAPAGDEIQVTSGPGDKLFPVVSGNSIVWYDDRSASVQLYDIPSGNTSTLSGSTSTPIGLSYELAIAGNNVVWTGVDPQAESDIVFLYDIASGRLQQVTDGSGAPGYPGVSEEFVVWIDGDELGDVYLYEITSGNITQVTDDPYEQLLADAGGNTMVWADNETEGGDLDIAVASPDLPMIRLLGDDGDDSYPDVSSDGTRIAWINARGNQTAVYLYDLSTENITQVTDESASPDAVAVDGNYVVYSDWRNGNLDIYLYDISTGMETPITQDPYYQSLPEISGGVVVWMGNNTGWWDIYTREVPGGSPPAPGQTTPVQPTPIQTPPPQPDQIQPGPIQTSSPGSGNAPTMTAVLQWQGDPSLPGWTVAGNPARGLTACVNPDEPDAIAVKTADGR